MHKNGKITTYDSRGKKQVKPVGEGYKLIRLAKRHVGGVYKLGGKHLKDPNKKGDKNKIDCTAFVQEIYKRYANISLPSGSHKKMIKYGLKIGKKIKSMEAAQMGDLVFYKNHGPRRGQHVAICAGNGMVIDASQSLNGVFVHSQSVDKPICIIRILRSGGARQVLTEEERMELEIAKVDKALNKYYKKRGETLPSKNYTFLNLYKNNKSIISDISSYDNKVSVYLTSNAINARAKYVKKLKLPPQPGMATDANGKVTLTGDVENYYRMLLSLGWLTTGNYALRYGISDEYNRIDAITVKSNGIYVDVSDQSGDTRQIIFNGSLPVRSYCNCKEGDKFLVERMYSEGDDFNSYGSYPMVLSNSAFEIEKKNNEYDFDYYDGYYEDELEKGAGIGIIEVGKPLPILYDEDGVFVYEYKYKGFRTAQMSYYSNGDGEGRLNITRYKDNKQEDYITEHTINVIPYDEKKLENEYKAIKDRVSKFICVDGTVINSYDEFKRLCQTGMNPYNDNLKKMFESILEKDNGYFGVFQ